MKNTTILAITLVAIIVLGVGIYIKSSTQYSPQLNSTGNLNALPEQKITLSVKDLNYYPNIITVKANQPVKIYLDNTVSGCLRAFTIPELGVSKYLQTAEDYIEFTPTKKGTFRFQCSMGMGYGTIIVE